MNTGDMEKYCPKPHPVYFNAFSMWQQLSGSVQYLINIHTYTHTYIHTYIHANANFLETASGYAHMAEPGSLCTKQAQ